MKPQVLSLGAGIQSTALLFLNAEGKITSPAGVAIFADTGGEMPATYRHLWNLAGAFPLFVVRKEPALEEAARKRPVLPMRSGDTLTPRRCTTSWKAEVIERWMTRNGLKPAVVQLGISIDESHRMKDSPTPWLRRRWPLIEMGWTREDCRRYLADRLDYEPARSACFFCPLRPRAWWKYLAAHHPDLFERACQVEEQTPNRPGFEAYRLSGVGRPLRQAFGGGQLPLRLFDDGQEGAECDGFCFI